MGERDYGLPAPDFSRSSHVEARPERLTSDAGAVVLREAGERLGMLSWLDARLKDPRDPDKEGAPPFPRPRAAAVTRRQPCLQTSGRRNRRAMNRPSSGMRSRVHRARSSARRRTAASSAPDGTSFGRSAPPTSPVASSSGRSTASGSSRKKRACRLVQAWCRKLAGRKKPPPCRVRKPAQEAAKRWCAIQDSNLWPSAPEADALSS